MSDKSIRDVCVEAHNRIEDFAWRGRESWISPLRLLALVAEQPGFYEITKREIPVAYGDPEPPALTRPVTKWETRWEIGADPEPDNPRRGLEWARGKTLREALQNAMDQGIFGANSVSDIG